MKVCVASVTVALLAIGCGSSGAMEPQGSAGVGGSSAGVGGAVGGQGSTGGAGAGGSGGSVAAQGGAGGGPFTGGTGQGEQGGQGEGGAVTGGGGAGGSSMQPPDGVPSGYTLVYSQPFAEPASMGDLVFANPTQWKYDAAGFIASTGASYAPPYRSPFSVAIVKSIQVKSFVMDAEMLQTSPDGDGHRDMVLIWNFVSPSQFYYAHISTVHDAVAHNIHIVNNADRKAISTTYTPGYDWGRDVWKKLRVVRDAESGSMSVIDLDTPDAPILTASDKTFTDGYVGFGSFDNSGQVRNVKVWAATSTPGAPDFFSPAD